MNEMPENQPHKEEPAGNSLKTMVHTLIWIGGLTLIWWGAIKLMELATGR